MEEHLRRSARDLAVALVITYDSVFVIELSFLVAYDLFHRLLYSGKIPVTSAVIHLTEFLRELLVL